MPTYADGKLTRTDGFYFIGKFKNGEPTDGAWYVRSGAVTNRIP